MNTKVALIIAVSAGLLGGGSIFAYDQEQYRDDNNRYQHREGDWDRYHGELARHIDRMNRMLAHVKWELSRYGASWRIRRDVDYISQEIHRVNWRFEHRRYGSREQLYADVQRLRWRLHDIENRLRVRSNDYFRWG